MTQDVLLSVPPTRGWQFWWSLKGDKMYLEEPPNLKTPPNHIIIRNGDVARIIVARAAQFPDKFWVSWEVTHAWRHPTHVRTSDEVPNDEAKGRFLTSRETILAMFGLSDQCSENDPAAAQALGAALFVQGRFVREGKRLSVPGPTAFGVSSGGTNVAVYITDDMKEAIKTIIR